MLTANQAQVRAGLQFMGDEPPVLVDWLPWNHTFGSNHNFNMVLDNGGSLYIDEGKPLPGAIEKKLIELARKEVEALMKSIGAKLWIQHDLLQFESLKKSPEFYD